MKSIKMEIVLGIILFSLIGVGLYTAALISTHTQCYELNKQGIVTEVGSCGLGCYAIMQDGTRMPAYDFGKPHLLTEENYKQPVRIFKQD